MEVWQLDHPTYGLIEVRQGFDAEFRELYDDWPGDTTENGVWLPADAPIWARARTWIKNPPCRLEISVDGQMQHRYESLESGRVPLFGPGKPELTVMTGLGTDRAKPHLKITVSPFKELLQIEFREGPTVVEFEPPAGSRGERRHEMMQSSTFRRTAIPMAEGLSKGGFALLALLLAPVFARVIAWIAGLLPDWELPEIHPPQVELPVPVLPQVELPLPNWSFPDIDLPEMPAWVQWLAEYAEIWLPIVMGVAVGIIALRNHRKSEQQKAQWKSQEPAHEAPAQEAPAREKT